MPSPISVAIWPRRAAFFSRSVTSIAITSIETRPAIGQRLPATTTSAPRVASLLAAAGPLLAPAGAKIAVGITGRYDREPGRPPRGPGTAIADALALLDIADL